MDVTMSLPPDSIQQRSIYNNYPRTNDEQNGNSDSPDPERPGGDKKATKHRRNYQACEPCRERKVKCELGDVDNPSPGPCAKCARESKDCWFNDTRKKGSSKEAARPTKRARTDSANSARPAPTLPHSPQLAAGFTFNTNPISPPRSFPGSSPGGLVTPVGLVNAQLNAGTFASSQAALFNMQSNLGNHTSQPRPSPIGIAQFSRPNHVVPIVQPNVNQFDTPNGHSSRNEDGDGHVLMPQVNSLAESFTNTTDNMSVLARAATITEGGGGGGSMHHRQRSRAQTDSGAEANPIPSSPQEQEARKKGLDAWKRMRFVRAGWFTPEEALNYIEFFYTHLAPMSPVILSDFRDPSTHQRLLTQEPILALSILAITSRYCPLNTYSRECRRSEIHKQLWNSLTQHVQRLLWGQEQFGGGFCGAGMAPLTRSVTGQITWDGSLRTLGTVEALMLLTDWQPRALHFPPLDHEDTLIYSDIPEDDIQPPQNNDSANLPYATWLEPAWRSDRMSWMLLGLALSLSYEIGVFDTRHELCGMQHGPDSDCARRRRLRRMVITYMSQISGRIGIPSPVHPNQDKDERGPELTAPIDRMQKLWFDISSLMFDANCQIFPSREYTAELVESGRYKQAIANFKPRLQKWLNNFDRVKHELPVTMRHVLRMEYEYSRLYINSLGLQKVVGQMALQSRNTVSRGPSTNLVAVHEENRGYIEEVRDAATQILKEACDGLGGLEVLTYSPVRTFLRTLSGMMFSLKLLSLGCEESTVRKTFKLLKEMTKKMTVQVVDDLHLSPHTARLVIQLMEDVHSSMIRIPKHTGSRGQSRQMSPQVNQSDAVPSMPYGAPSEHESPDPLAQIRLADFNNQSFLPPPNFDASMPFDANMTFDNNIDPAMYTLNEDWFSLPIDNLFGRDGTQVNQGYGGIGPTFGDRDMLSILTDTQWDQNQNGISQNFSGFGNGF